MFDQNNWSNWNVFESHTYSEMAYSKYIFFVYKLLQLLLLLQFLLQLLLQLLHFLLQLLQLLQFLLQWLQLLLLQLLL